MTAAATFGGAARSAGGAAALRPGLCFWVAGILVYGGMAAFWSGHFLDQTSRDLWQHLAALRALIESPFSPGNPFVPGSDGSRHFHPYWVGMALLARLLGWNEWQAITAAGFVSAGVLLAGIWTFARAYYRDSWAPLALLAAMVLGWTLPVSHTGFHSPETLVEGMGYPAALLVGLSLLLWALVIRALDRPALALLAIPLTAFMVATHQLGAGIGLIGAGCFALLTPAAGLRGRAAACAAMAAGLGLAALWPHHSPFEAVARAGNPTWSGGLDFYAPRMLITAGLPSLLGLWGLLDPRFRDRARPVLAAFLLFAGLFALGALGVLIATRFLMPAVLMLHIGLAGAILALARGWAWLGRSRQLAAFGLALACVQFHLLVSYFYLGGELEKGRVTGNVYEAARALTADIPDDRPVAVYDVAAWPVVATGQKLVSIPWPEPMIGDLDRRQRAVERMFDPDLEPGRRAALARSWGATTLILDRRGALRRRFEKRLIERLEAQSVRRRDAGPFIRFDLR